MNLREGVRSAPVRPYRGMAYCHIGETYADRPLSGLGSYRRGGRFNPAGAFSLLYLCTTYRCVTEEFWRRIRIADADPLDLLPRVAYEYQVSLEAVLDLTDRATLRHLRMDVGTDFERSSPDQGSGRMRQCLRSVPGNTVPLRHWC